MIFYMQKTRIGMAVNVLRKSSTNPEVQTISKGLIKSWKKLLTGSKLVESFHRKGGQHAIMVYEVMQY